METIIIDKNYNIKTCWNGKPVGKVGDPLEIIIENLNRKQIEIERKRECSDCIRYDDCSRCLFPGLINEDRFCEYKKKFDSINAADTVRSLEFFKEFAND